jgi:FkbM family methyltransferase
MVCALTLELIEPFKIVVENKLDKVSTYVFLEQETWFEAEVSFFHEFLKPGMRVVDIGTNCGFYTLLAAHKIGPTGHVWGFEPGLTPHRLLQESLRINHFTNVTLYEAAVGAISGTAWFSDLADTEFNAVVDEATPNARQVKVESLDNLYRSGEIKNIDFIKIDAEGFEDQVILGAKTFFEEESPLVMLEVTVDNAPSNMQPAEMLCEFGYEMYRYYPELGCLTPLVKNKIGDHLLNIFLCKPDRAASLRAQDLLVSAEDLAVCYQDADPASFIDYFLQLPVVKTCRDLEEMGKHAAPEFAWPGYYEMAGEFLLSQDRSRPCGERYLRFCKAETWIDHNFREDMPLAMKLSFVRVWSAGCRSLLVANLLGRIADGTARIALTLEQPFLPTSAKWETTPAKDGNFFPWLVNMIADSLELSRSFSSFLVSLATRETYGLARRYGYLSQSLERRAALASLLRGYEEFPPPVFIAGPVDRNQKIWNEIAAKLARGEKGPVSFSDGTELAG